MDVVDLRLHGNCQAVLLFIGDHADDRPPAGLSRRPSESEALADRIGLTEVEPGQRVVDDDHGGPSRVGCREIASSQQTKPNGVEVAGCHALVAQLTSPDLRTTLDEKVTRPASTLEGQTHRRPRGAHPRNRSEALDDRGEEAGDLCVRVVATAARHGNPEREGLRRIDAGIDSQQALEAAKQQSCPDEQDHGQRDLGDDQDAAGRRGRVPSIHGFPP